MLTEKRQIFGAGEKDIEQGSLNRVHLNHESDIAQIGPDALKKWQILYCGGSQPVVDSLSRISADLKVDFRMEKFDW